MKKRILSILLTLCMVLCLVPTGVYAEGEAATGSSAIRYSIDGIHGYDATDGYSYIYYGVHNGNPVKWRVLDTKTNTGEADALFLMTDECMGSLGNGYIQFNPTNKADRYLWKGSAVQTWCGDFYDKAFTTTERALIPAVSTADSVYSYRSPGMPSYYPAFDYKIGGLESEYVFAPSIQDIYNADYGFTNSNSRIAGPLDSTGLGTRYWIRSYFDNLPQYVGEYANMTGDQRGETAAVRPAMNLSTAGYNVLFSSAAVGGKPDGGLQPVSQNYTGNEWKLTLEDSSRLNFRVTGDVIAATDDTTGDTVKIRYTGAKAGANEYVSAIIVGNGRSVTYYGRSNAALTETDGTAELTIPAGFAPGTYTLYVFNEQYNGDCKTDLAGNFSLITLTVTKRVKEQFSLAHGGRYYFDLSAVDIPGTVNSDLPDSTLHYVPFTYAGTVDAYSLKSENDTDTTSYKHSLFIADYNIAKAIDWTMLNGKNLIFGKSYTAGGLNYTLRAPSVGRQVRDSHLTPVSNEWDMILLKSDDYIKNQNTIYSAGQDIWANSEYSSVYRGYDESGYMWRFEQKANDNPSSERAYRPVLELPTDLAADSLKIVKLRTGEFMPGENQNWINIIVKNGESFKAPAAEGLPRPDGISADAQLWWVDENFNFYKPGDTVPSDVSALTAFWGGFGLLLDRGDGAVEVTPDNYTDIFGDGTASFVFPRGESLESLTESHTLTYKEHLEFCSTGKLEEHGCVFPNLKLNGVKLTEVKFDDTRYSLYTDEDWFFITLTGENAIESLKTGHDVDNIGIIGDGSLTLNSTLKLNQYTQFGGSSVAMTDGLKAYNLIVDSGSLTVTGDTQAITLRDQDISNLNIGDGVRLLLGSSAQDAAEAVIPQLSAEMQELYKRYQADDNTLTSADYIALFNALREQFNAIFPQLSGKTYVRIANAWDVTYQPGTDGTGDAVTDIKFYNDILSLRGKLFTRTGYTQVGWATIDGGEKIYGLDDVYTQNEALTLYPVWNTNKYTITFDTNGGSEIASITRDYGTTIAAPANPTREGYTFIGWDKEIPATMPAENVTITAQWKINQYTITFDTNGGSEIASITQDYGSAITAPANPTREGYTFIGWDKEIPANMPAENITITAQWRVNQYTITFDTAGGNEIASITQDYGSAITAPADPTREGYTFIGWNKEIPETMPAENITITAEWKDSEKPTGEIKISENSWKSFLNNITFGLFFNETQTVTINASDNGSGIKTVEYLLSDKELTKAELDAMTFTAYTAPFGIDPDNEYIIYVRLTDNADNVSYICSDGIVLDGTSPIITGIENGKIYCEAQTVTITEKYVDTVTVNGTAVTLDENNSFVLAPADGEQKIVVTDKAGNTAEMTVTVNDGHTFGEWESNSDGTHTHKCTVDGCNGSETKDCSGGKATCTDKAVCEVCAKAYGEIDANNHADLKHILAKAATKDAEGNIEYWYCDGCGKYYSDATATKEIKKADTVTSKLPDGSKSPQTGDNSNLMLWIALMFICGGVTIGTTVIGKKK